MNIYDMSADNNDLTGRESIRDAIDSVVTPVISGEIYKTCMIYGLIIGIR